VYQKCFSFLFLFTFEWKEWGSQWKHRAFGQLYVAFHLKIQKESCNDLCDPIWLWSDMGHLQRWV